MSEEEAMDVDLQVDTSDKKPVTETKKSRGYEVPWYGSEIGHKCVCYRLFGGKLLIIAHVRQHCHNCEVWFANDFEVCGHRSTGSQIKMGQTV